MSALYNSPMPPDDPAFGWSGIHVLTDNGVGTAYRCSCGRSKWSDADSVRTHIEWALRAQNETLWNAGQRVCNDTPGAMEFLRRTLDFCLPRTEDEAKSYGKPR